MADIRLGGTDRERAGAAGEHGAQGVHLDGVAERRAGAVRLDDVDRLRIEPCIGERRADHRLLCRQAGRGDAGAAAILVQRAAADHREHRVLRRQGVGQPLQHHDAGALALAEPIGGGVERLAAAIRRHHAGAAERHRYGRTQHEMHAAGQRHAALARAQRLHGQVHRHQRGRTGGIHHDRRPGQAEPVGDPSGGDRGHPAGQSVAAEPLRFGQRGVQVVAAVEAEEHAGTAALQRFRALAGMGERRPGGLQQQAVLRVHGGGLAGGDAEQVVVEAVDVIEEGGLAEGDAAGGVGVG